MTLVSKVAIFHFHDYGWKGTSTYEAQTRALKWIRWYLGPLVSGAAIIL